MVSIKFTGKGLVSRGIKFSPDVNGGVYSLEETDANYLLETFPAYFILIEKKVEKKTETKKKVVRKKKVVGTGAASTGDDKID